MASLTDQLSSPTSGKGIIATQVERPSFIAGLSRLVSGADNAVSGLQTQKRQADSDARMAKQDARREGLVDALNVAEQSVFDAFSPGPTGVNVRTDTVSVWDAEAGKAATALGKTQKAIDQGRMTGAAFQLQLERVQADLFQQFPEYKAEIAQYMQGRGFDSYVFREQKQAAAFDDQVEASKRQAFKENVDFAVSAGIPFNELDPAQTAIVGSQLRAAEYQRKIKLEEAKFAREQVDNGQKDYKFNQEIAEKQAAGAVGQEAVIKLGGIIPTLSNLIAAAGDDAGKQKVISDIIPMIPGVFQSYKASAAAQIQNPVVRKALMDEIEELEKSTVDLYRGPLSQYKVNIQTVDNMSKMFSLETGKTMPVYSRLKSMMGSAAVNEIFGGAVPLPADVKIALQHEFDGYKTANAREGQVILNNVAQIIKGDKNLKDLSEKEARQQMPVLTKAAIGAAKDVNTDGGDPMALDTFRNAYSNLLNAAVEIQPGTPDINSVLSASSIVASRESRQAAVKGYSVDKERFAPVILGSRGAATQLLEVAKGLPVKEDRTSFHDLAYDERTGRYYAKPDKAKYDQWMKRQGTVPNMPWTPLKDIKPSADLNKKIDSLNLNLNHLVETAQYDPKIPKGTTPLQLAKRYAVGGPIGRTDTAGKPAKSADQQFKDSADQFKAELRELPSKIAPVSNFKIKDDRVGNLVSSAAEQYGIPDGIAHSVAYQESRGRQGAVSPKGATGVMQLMPGTAADLGVDPNDEQQNIEGGMKYLRQMYDKFGDWEKALAAYNAGPGAVTKYGGIPPYKETQNYVAEILGRS